MFGVGAASPGSTMTVWVEETNRTAHIQNVGDEVVDVGGVRTLRYRMLHSEFLSASVYPPNAEWYMFGPTGVLNVTRCSLGVPLFLSKPHLLGVKGAFNGTELGGGNAPLLERLRGDVQPDAALHDTYLDVEPLSGAALAAAQRLQGNAWLAPQVLATGSTNLTLFADVSPALLPLVWVEKGGAATNEALRTVKSKLAMLRLAQRLALVLGFGGCVASALCLAVGGRRLWIERRAGEGVDEIDEASTDNAAEPLLRAVV